MSKLKKKCLIFFEIISIILVIISYILYIIQSFLNHNFTKDKSKKNFTERLLYKIFSEEIYNNIRSFPISKILNIKSNNSEPFIIEVKLDTKFDCQGVKSGFLNEYVCQNKLVDNLTCCKSECCPRNITGITHCNNYNFNIRNYYLEKNVLTYNSDELIDDPRRRYCQYINQFSGNTTKIFNYDLQKENFNYTYEKILLNDNNINTFIKIEKNNSKNDLQDFTDCGEIDSMKKHLYVKGIKCPINFISSDTDNNVLVFDSIPDTSLGIIVKNYLTEIPPTLHEWNYYYNNELITIKDINELLNIKNKDNSEFNNYYQKQDAYVYINHLPNFSEYINKINKYQKIFLYTTNYIGFESKEDLDKFKSIFNENNMIDNPLYKIRDDLFPSTETFVISIIIFILYIIFFVKYLYENKNEFVLYSKYFKLKEIITFLSLIAFFIIYIIYTQVKYKKININLDPNYKEIINLYNKRRKQDWLLAGIIFHFIACGYEVYYFLQKDSDIKQKDVRNNITKAEQDNLSSNISNYVSNTIEDEINQNVEIIQASANRFKESLRNSVHADEKIIKFAK